MCVIVLKLNLLTISKLKIFNMKRYNYLFCDLDGTLIDTISGKPFPDGIWDMKFKMDVLDAIKTLKPEFVFIVTNQGGIENGLVNETNFRSKLEYVCMSLRELIGNENVTSYYCASNDVNNQYRKPNTKMLEELTERFVGDDFDFIKQKSLMIGDASGLEGQFSDSDKKTAENFGIDYMDVKEFVKKINDEKNL